MCEECVSAVLPWLGWEGRGVQTTWLGGWWDKVATFIAKKHCSYPMYIVKGLKSLVLIDSCSIKTGKCVVCDIWVICRKRFSNLNLFLTYFLIFHIFSKNFSLFCFFGQGLDNRVTDFLLWLAYSANTRVGCVEGGTKPISPIKG